MTTTHVGCRDGRTLWIEEYDSDVSGSATSNVVMTFDDESEARAWLAGALLSDALDAGEVGDDATSDEIDSLISIYTAEGFGGREKRVTDPESAREVLGERLAWLRSQRAEGTR